MELFYTGVVDAHVLLLRHSVGDYCSGRCLRYLHFIEPSWFTLTLRGFTPWRQKLD